MRTTIEMAREAAGDDWGLFQEFMPEIHRLAELVRADERARMAQQPAQQEPVATLFGSLPVYDTSPPAQRTWVGLTDEEAEKCRRGTWQATFRAIGDLLREKNGGKA